MQRNNTYSFYPGEDFSYLLSNKGDLFLKYLFDRYYTELCTLSFRYVGRTDIAEDIVQEIFINIWNRRFSLNCKGRIKPYIIKSVINSSINYIQSKFAKQNTVEGNSAGDMSAGDSPHDELVNNELSQLVTMAIEQLPDKCRTIFSMSRFSYLSNKEIATQLRISIKTVEAQMSIAIKKIRQFLSRFGYLLLYVIF